MTRTRLFVMPNLVPLAAVLLIPVFILAAPTMTRGHRSRVVLPVAAAPVYRVPAEDDIHISMTAERGPDRSFIARLVWVGRYKHTWPQVEGVLRAIPPGPTVVLDVDARLPMASVHEMLGILRRTGHVRVFLITDAHAGNNQLQLLHRMWGKPRESSDGPA